MTTDTNVPQGPAAGQEGPSEGPARGRPAMPPPVAPLGPGAAKARMFPGGLPSERLRRPAGAK